MRHDLIVPELGLAGGPIVLSTWLVRLGSEVNQGDRIVELLADGVTVDLSSPASGRLVEACVDEDASVCVGQVLGRVEAPEEEDD